ncbi:MAG: hypothetical protein D6679_03555 [Candidatus Hydrogenedentota bacterium]|nr:MAG: hypothetical protein D6679_03555 [Candidatus Hydrogenedentota bacterium]
MVSHLEGREKRKKERRRRNGARENKVVAGGLRGFLVGVAARRLEWLAQIRMTTAVTAPPIAPTQTAFDNGRCFQTFRNNKGFFAQLLSLALQFR